MELKYIGKDKYCYPRMLAATPEAADRLLTIKSKLESAGYTNLPIWSPPDSVGVVIVSLRQKDRKF